MSESLVSEPGKPRRFYGQVLVGYSFFMGFMCSAFFLHSRGIFFPSWMADFEVERTEISLVVTLVLFTSSCFAPLAGFLIDRFPLRTLICLGSTWLAIGYVLLRTVDSYVAFLAIFVLFQGLGWSYVGPLIQTKLMVNWFARNRGMALGIAIMGISVAGIVMPTVVTYLLETLGWRNTYTLYGGLLIVLVIPVTLLVVRQSPAVMGLHQDGDDAPLVAPEPKVETPPKPLFAQYREFLSSKAFWSVVITFGLMNGVYSAMITHLPTYLTTELTFSLLEASYVLGFAGGFAIAGKIVFGWLMDHSSARGTVMVGVSSYFLSTLVFIFADSYLLMMVAASLFGLGFGGMVPVRSVIVSRLFGAAKFSKVNGLLAFFIAPATFWVLITGYLSDQTGTYTTAFQVWAVAFALAGIVSMLVNLPNREDAVP